MDMEEFDWNKAFPELSSHLTFQPNMIISIPESFTSRSRTKRDLMRIHVSQPPTDATGASLYKATATHASL